MTTWWPQRRRVAKVAMYTATLTGSLSVLLGATIFDAVLYVAVSLVAVFSPAAIAVQVILGLVLIGGLALAGDGLGPLLVLPLLAGVVATAESLGVVAELDLPIERDLEDSLPRVATATGIAVAVFGTVSLIVGIGGPGGWVATLVASGACAALAALLLGQAVAKGG